jgi:putative phosphoesterase
VKLGIISDIHCNLAALHRVLAALSDADRLLCLGDCINAGRFCAGVVAALKERDALMVLGNHEEAYLASDAAKAPQHEEPQLLKWLALQPLRRKLEHDGTRVLMVHSTPWEPRGDYIFPHNEEIARFGETEADVVLYGHTHAPLIHRVGSVLVINPGSAGEPRYAQGGWHLHCAVLDTVSREAGLLAIPDPARP